MRQGIRFKIHPVAKVVVAGREKTFRPDVLLRDLKVFIEVNGCYWHGCRQCYGNDALQRDELYDHLRTLALRSTGHEVVEIWEHEDVEGRIREIIAG